MSRQSSRKSLARQKEQFSLPEAPSPPARPARNSATERSRPRVLIRPVIRSISSKNSPLSSTRPRVTRQVRVRQAVQQESGFFHDPERLRRPAVDELCAELDRQRPLLAPQPEDPAADPASRLQQ